MSQKFSPQNFIVALKENTLKEVSFIEGMAKADEKNPDSLLFTAAGCEAWTSIPLSSIETIDYLKSVACKDHEHPYVVIHFKKFDAPEARMLAGLLSSHAIALRSGQSNASRNKPGSGFCSKFCSACDRSGDPDSDACQKCRRCYR